MDLSHRRLVTISRIGVSCIGQKRVRHMSAVYSVEQPRFYWGLGLQLATRFHRVARISKMPWRNFTSFSYRQERTTSRHGRTCDTCTGILRWHVCISNWTTIEGMRSISNGQNSLGKSSWLRGIISAKSDTRWFELDRGNGCTTQFPAK